jgi:hypothetical protein
MIARESIYAALWALGAGAASFASANRRLRHWADVAPAEQPALFMSEKGGHAVTKALGGPIAWTLYADFYVYVHSSDPYLAPALLLNPLLDALEAALAPSPATGIQNLGLPAPARSKPTKACSAIRRSRSSRSRSCASDHATRRRLVTAERSTRKSGFLSPL